MNDIDIAVDHRLRRRLVFQAQYHINCETTTGNIAELASTKAMAGHAFGYSEICSTGKIGLQYIYYSIMTFMKALT